MVQGSIDYTLPVSYDWISNTTDFATGSASAKSTQVPKVLEMAYTKSITKDWTLNTSSRYTFNENDNILTANIGVAYTW